MSELEQGSIVDFESTFDRREMNNNRVVKKGSVMGL